MDNSHYSNRVRSGTFPLFRSKAPILTKLSIELTERCNNNCVHCCINLHQDDESAKLSELETDLAKSILEEAANLGCMQVRYTGGEPLLRDDFEELYLYARRLGLRVIVFTNATLITNEIADLFKKYPPLAPVEISLYGMHAGSYEKVSRISGSFDAAFRGVERLLERQIPFIVKGTILPPNKHETEEFENWYRTVVKMTRKPSYSIMLHLRNRREEDKNKAIRKLRPSPQEILDFMQKREIDWEDEMKEFCSRFIGPPGDDLFACGAGDRDGCVDSYGMLQPCLSLRAPETSYDLKNGSLKDAFTNFFPKVRKMRPKNPSYFQRCARCFLKGLCEQCPAKSWFEHGNIDTPVEYLCEVAHLQARFLGLLGDFENGWEVDDWRNRIQDM